MDDLSKSVPSLLETCSLQTGLAHLLSLGGFRLTNWISNDRDLLNAIPEKEQEHSVRSIGYESLLPVGRPFGVTWNVQNDTRRKVVSLTASIFDSIGCCQNENIPSISVEASPGLGRTNSWSLQEWSDWQKQLGKLSEFSVLRSNSLPGVCLW